MNFDEYMTNGRCAAWLENRTRETWFDKVRWCHASPSFFLTVNRKEDAHRACSRIRVWAKNAHIHVFV